MLGLDAARKTTILFKLKLGETVRTVPTIGFRVEIVYYKNLDFTIWDVGGQISFGQIWNNYFANTDALIYVVDSSDRYRLGEASERLQWLLN